MPTSIDPQPAEDEIECGHCGAYIYYELTRCPNCGINLYEPEDETDTYDREKSHPPSPPQPGIGTRLGRFVQQLMKKPTPADELFGTSINQAELFDNLLIKVGGDRAKVEHLIDFERQQTPQGNRMIWLRNAIQRREQDNRG